MTEIPHTENKPDTAFYPDYRPVFDTLNALPIPAVLALTRAFENRSLPKEAQDDVVQWMGWLPSSNAPHARAVYGAHLTGSEADRCSVITYLSSPTHFDPEFGLLMWDRLLTDPSKDVRRRAVDQLDWYIGLNEVDGAGGWLDEFPVLSTGRIAKLLYKTLRVEQGWSKPSDPTAPIPELSLPAWATRQPPAEQ